MIFVYTTVPNMDAGKALSRNIIEKKLASAVNIWPTQSVYTWQGKVKEGEGCVLFIRTLEKNIQLIEDLIDSNASNIPCVAAIDVKRINHRYREEMVRVMAA